MTPNKKLKRGIAIIFLAILAYVVNFTTKYAYIGSAYDAKMVCSCTFVSHRNFESIEPDASGTYVGLSFMFATARDWAKFGQLNLQDGVWNGESILPEGWVKYSSTETPNSIGQYAAHFWLNHNNNLYQSDVYHAIGFEGQYVTIVSSKNLVIVRLGCTSKDNFDHPKLVRELLKAV